MNTGVDGELPTGVESAAMTLTHEIYLAVFLAFAFALFFEFIHLGALIRKIFAWTLSLNSFRQAMFYRRLAQRNTSYTGVISYLASAIFSAAAVHQLQPYPHWMTYTGALAIYSTFGFSISNLTLLVIEADIRRYEYLKTIVRPRVEESFLIEQDSRFAHIESKADYDAVIDALVHAPQTNPRTT